MFRVHAPGPHAFLGLELDHRYPLAVLGEESFVRDITGHGFGERVHAVSEGDIVVLDAWQQARTENGDDHRESPSKRPMLRPLPAPGKCMFSMGAIVPGDYSTLASIASMSSSE